MFAFLLWKSLWKITSGLFTTAVYIENDGIRRYHVLENDLTLTKKSQSLNWVKTQNLSEVAFEFSFAPLIFFYIHFQFWITYKFRGSLSKPKEKNELNSNFIILLNPLWNMSDFFAHQFSRKWLIRTSHKSGNQSSMAQYYYGQYTMRSI